MKRLAKFVIILFTLISISWMLVFRDLLGHIHSLLSLLEFCFCLISYILRRLEEFCTNCISSIIGYLFNRHLKFLFGNFIVFDLLIEYYLLALCHHRCKRAINGCT